MIDTEQLTGEGQGTLTRTTGGEQEGRDSREGQPQLMPKRVNQLVGLVMAGELVLLAQSPWVTLERTTNEGAISQHTTNVEVSEEAETSVWGTAKLQQLLQEPMGSPVVLTQDEALEVVRLAFGRRPDLPRSEDFVRDVRELLGHSVMERLNQSNG